MITVNNLTRYYGDFLAVNAINFEIRKGEIVGLLGPNGAGKSTTIRMLTTYLEPTSGTINIGGYDVVENPLLVKKMIGYIPESAPLYSDMVVYDYLQYISRIQEVPESQIAERISFVIDKCGLSEVIHKKIGELSKGYKQRTGLAHAIIHNPEILVLDEPTSGLDPNQIIEIRELIKELGREKTVILSSHILSEVEATCDRVIIINKGNVVADGPTENLLSGKGQAEKFIIQVKTNQNKDAVASAMRFEGVESVDVTEEEGLKNIVMLARGGDDLRDNIYRHIKSTDWIVYGLSKQTQTLESIFQQLQ